MVYVMPSSATVAVKCDGRTLCRPDPGEQLARRITRPSPNIGPSCSKSESRIHTVEMEKRTTSPIPM